MFGWLFQLESFWLMKINKVSLYVLNYNGAQLLTECLPSILQSIKRSRYNAKLFVIDNQSTDNSLDVLKKEFASVPVLLPNENRYLCAFNQYVFADDADIVVLMNNDIRVDEHFLDPLIRVFETHEDAFLASALCWDFSGKRYEGGLSVLRKKYGWWGTLAVDPTNQNFPYTASVGANMVFRRDRFVALKGFDDLFLPLTLEDLDICYRGWKRGWKAYFVRDSIIYHKSQATFKQKFGSAKIRELAMRNTFLFIWKNIYDTLLLFDHLFWIGPRLLGALFKADFPFISGFFKALPKMGSAWKKRAEGKSNAQLSDRKVLSLFKPLSL